MDARIEATEKVRRCIGGTGQVMPGHWINRKAGESKLKIQGMGSRYLLIVLYCLMEKSLSRGPERIMRDFVSGSRPIELVTRFGL